MRKTLNSIDEKATRFRGIFQMIRLDRGESESIEFLAAHLGKLRAEVDDLKSDLKSLARRSIKKS